MFVLAFQLCRSDEAGDYAKTHVLEHDHSEGRSRCDHTSSGLDGASSHKHQMSSLSARLVSFHPLLQS